MNGQQITSTEKRKVAENRYISSISKSKLPKAQEQFVQSVYHQKKMKKESGILQK